LARSQNWNKEFEQAGFFFQFCDLKNLAKLVKFTPQKNLFFFSPPPTPPKKNNNKMYKSNYQFTSDSYFNDEDFDFVYHNLRNGHQVCDLNCEFTLREFHRAFPILNLARKSTQELGPSFFLLGPARTRGGGAQGLLHSIQLLEVFRDWNCEISH